MTTIVAQPKQEYMVQEVGLDRRASIGDAEEEIWWVGKYLTEKGVDVDLDTVLDGNFGMTS